MSNALHVVLTAKKCLLKKEAREKRGRERKCSKKLADCLFRKHLRTPPSDLMTIASANDVRDNALVLIQLAKATGAFVVFLSLAIWADPIRSAHPPWQPILDALHGHALSPMGLIGKSRESFKRLFHTKHLHSLSRHFPKLRYG